MNPRETKEAIKCNVYLHDNIPQGDDVKHRGWANPGDGETDVIVYLQWWAETPATHEDPAEGRGFEILAIETDDDYAAKINIKDLHEDVEKYIEQCLEDELNARADQ